MCALSTVVGRDLHKYVCKCAIFVQTTVVWELIGVVVWLCTKIQPFFKHSFMTLIVLGFKQLLSSISSCLSAVMYFLLS